MKKSKIYILALLLATFFLTGCKSKITDLNGETKDIFRINETAIYKDIYFKITKVEYLYESIEDYKIKDENRIALAITFEIENKSKKSYSVLGIEPLLNVDVKDSNAYSFTRKPQEIVSRDYVLKPNETFRETDYFEVDDDKRNLKYKLLIDAENDKKISIDLEETLKEN